MRIDYLMKENINVHESYVKKKSGNSIFITHNSTGKVLLTVNERLRVYRLYKNKILKSKTQTQIEKYFQEKGYKKI